MSVHNHPPYRPVCNERRVAGQLRGACLTDEGDPVSDTQPDLDAIEREHRLFVHPDEGIDMCWQCRVEAPCESLALVELVRDLRDVNARLVQQLSDTEAERDLIGDTLARRSAAHDRLAQRLDQVRALADEWDADWREDLNVVELHAELRRVLDGDQQTKDTP